MKKLIKGVCIKQYLDEDSLQRFNDGEIEESEIEVYKVGDVGDIVTGLYNKNYWKEIEQTREPNR